MIRHVSSDEMTKVTGGFTELPFRAHSESKDYRKPGLIEEGDPVSICRNALNAGVFTPAEYIIPSATPISENQNLLPPLLFHGARGGDIESPYPFEKQRLNALGLRDEPIKTAQRRPQPFSYKTPYTKQR